jgi:hypothetical protein
MTPRALPRTRYRGGSLRAPAGELPPGRWRTHEAAAIHVLASLRCSPTGAHTRDGEGIPGSLGP